MATNDMKKLRGAMKIGAKIGNAAVSRTAKATFSTIPIKISIYHTGKELQLGKFVKKRNKLVFIEL